MPKGVLLHHADVPKHERVDIGAIPVTSVLRTLCDCVDALVSPDLVAAAVAQARARGLVTRDDVKMLRARERAA